MKKKIRAAVVGYGNIGKYVVEALQVATRLEIAGIVRRDVSKRLAELKGYEVVTAIAQLKEVDVAILCAYTEGVMPAKECLDWE